MAEEEKNEQAQEEQAEEKAPEAEEKAPEAEEKAPEEEAEAPAEETPAEDEAPAEDETPAEEEAEETPDEDETPEDEGDEASPDTTAAEGEDVAEEAGDWKARRRLERSRRSGEAGPQRGADERATERAQHRALAARRRSSYRKQRGKGDRGEGTPPAERRSAGRKVRQGRVVSNKPDKTITVQIDVVRRHTSYEKIIRHSSTLHAHDEQNEANQGDLVRVVETRPLSRTKRWRLVEVLEKAK